MVPKASLGPATATAGNAAARTTEADSRAIGRPASPAADILGREVKYLPGVGPRKAELLGHLGLHTVKDLLYHLPRRYEDRRHLRRIGDAVAGETQTLYGKVALVGERKLRTGRTLVEARLVEADASAAGSGSREGGPRGWVSPAAGLDLVWFNQPYVLEWVRPGARLFAYGQVKSAYGSGQFKHDLDQRFPQREELVTADIPDRDGILPCIRSFLGRGR